MSFYDAFMSDSSAYKSVQLADIVSDIICMLTNITTILPDPKRPAFYTGRSGIQAQLSSTGKTDECSLNCVSISVIEAR